MFCQKCGAEVAEDAAVCMSCGCAVGGTPAPAKKAKKPVSKKVIIFSSIGAVVLVLAILALAIFLPKEVTLDTLDAQPNKVAALFKLGVPQETRSHMWIYEDISVCGIEVDQLCVYHEEGKYVLWENDESDQEELAELLVDRCEYDHNASGLFYYFDYGNLEITADNDCWYISMQYKK